MIHRFPLLLLCVSSILLGGCVSQTKEPSPSKPTRGRLIVAGKEIPVTFEVKTWQDSGGYDAHRESCFFSDGLLPTRPAPGCDEKRRYRPRPAKGFTGEDLKTIENAGWTLPLLKQSVDQFVIHYDVCGTSRRCFKVLHDLRGLSVHFLLDVDGTLYQTLDLAHRARHAGSSNSRSIGIEIAHFGAYPKGSKTLKQRWQLTSDGLEINLPENLGPPPGGPFFAASAEMHEGRINGSQLLQPDFTEAQYVTLSHLTDALIKIFPKIKRQVPRLANGDVDPNVLSADSLANFQGVLGHWHVTKKKIDPGPAFNWDRVVRDRQPGKQ